MKRPLMLAVRRTDVDELNRRARAHVAAAGRLTRPALTVADRTFAAGDLVITYLTSGGLDHGYVLAVHQSQGMIRGRAMLLGFDPLYREAGYVGLSPGRRRNDLHRVDRVADDLPGREDCHALQRRAPEVEEALTAVRTALARSRPGTRARRAPAEASRAKRASTVVKVKGGGQDV